MTRRNWKYPIILVFLLLAFVGRLAAQENHIQFNVVNDTARIDAVIEEDSLGNLINSMYDSNLDNVDHGNGLLFTYFNWMPGYNLYQNFDIVTIHYRHQGSAPRDTIDLTGYCHPAKYRITSNYGYRHRRMHRGVDLGYPEGTPVAAAWDGIVRISKGTANTGGYGNLIILRHSNGLETYYGHLSKLLVEPGEQVRAGDIIGLGGSTGRSTGPHLHFETRYKGRAFDPERIIDFRHGALRSSLFCLKKDYFSIYSHYGQTDKESKAASQAQYYKVRKGDTLGKIAARHGTTVNNICKLNKIKANKTLRIGETLRIR